jgi:hypothetical protein
MEKKEEYGREGAVYDPECVGTPGAPAFWRMVNSVPPLRESWSVASSCMTSDDTNCIPRD